MSRDYLAILFDKGLLFLEEDSVMYLPFDKSILSNIPCFGHIILKYVVVTSGITILKILFFISLSPMMILITEGI
jgi:hypothetical protein